MSLGRFKDVHNIPEYSVLSGTRRV